MPTEIMNIIWSAVGIILTGLASWGVAALTKWLNSKISDKDVAAKITKILNIIADAVKQIYQEFVEVLKNEGKFDEAAQKQAKEKALAIIKGQLTEDLKTYITSTFGDVETYISNQIEVALYNLKNLNK